MRSFASFLLIASIASTALAQQPPAVLRTFTHHQVTTVTQGVGPFSPVVSGGGGRILFSINPSAPDRAHALATIAFDGGDPSIVDDSPGISSADISADGAVVAYLVGSQEVRVAGADGANRRTVFGAAEASLGGVRISGDGRTVFFMIGRGGNLKVGDKLQPLIRGIYAVGVDGSGFRRVLSPEEIAPVRGCKPDEVANPNLTFDHRNVFDVSHDGSRVVLATLDKTAAFIASSDAGRIGIVVTARAPQPGDGYMSHFHGVTISADGSTVAYAAYRPYDLGVVPFAGGNPRVLLNGDEQPRFGFTYGAPIWITADGKRLVFCGRHFNSDGSGSFTLMAAHHEGVLRYWEYEQMGMDYNGRRFAYWPYTPRPAQLATMEINVPTDRLGSAPRVGAITIEPPAIPRQRPKVAASLTAVRATADFKPIAVSATGFIGGHRDDSLCQGGSVGITDHYDDGKPDASGDKTTGDDIYSRRWLLAYDNAPADPPRTLRFAAQIQDSAKRFHAQVVEIGPLPVVEGQPAGGPATIDVQPPPPPSVGPLPPGVVTDPGTTTPPGPTTPGPIDLTGYWKTEVGDIYYVRQIGDAVYWSMEGLPRVRNVFVGKLSGTTLSGTWVDLPGGTINSNTGVITLTVDSNDKMTKTSATIAYLGEVWTRIAKPGGGGGGTGGPVVPPANAPWQTPAGRAAIDKWIAVAMGKINAHAGGAEFNGRKPWSINKYGILEGKGITSAFAPDNFKDYNNDRYWYMWDYWVPSPITGWRWPEWNAAGVPPLREFVMKELGL